MLTGRGSDILMGQACYDFNSDHWSDMFQVSYPFTCVTRELNRLRHLL